MAILVLVLVKYIRMVGVQSIGFMNKPLASILCFKLFESSFTRFVRLGFHGKARVVFFVDYVEFSYRPFASDFYPFTVCTG